MNDPIPIIKPYIIPKRLGEIKSIKVPRLIFSKADIICPKAKTSVFIIEVNNDFNKGEIKLSKKRISIKIISTEEKLNEKIGLKITYIK